MSKINLRPPNHAVDFAAPSDIVLQMSQRGDTDLMYYTIGATSFSAPVVAGVASVLISRFPEIFDRNPKKLIERIANTLDQCNPPRDSSFRGCVDSNGESNMLHPGIVDLYKALDTNAEPLPELKIFENESWRVDDMEMKNTTDVDFIDLEGDGVIDYMIEVYEGGSNNNQPRIYAYDPGSGLSNINQVCDINALCWPVLPSIPGNYSKIAHADFNGDGCTDIVLAGCRDARDGVRNVILEQQKHIYYDYCFGYYEDVTETNLPSRVDITNDVDIFDVNNDDLPDILFTNTGEIYNHYDGQIFVNSQNEPGVFIEETDLRLPLYITPHPDLPDLPQSSSICDVDGDGDMDIVQAVKQVDNSYCGRNRLLINNGNGIFTEEAHLRGFADFTGFSSDVVCSDLSGYSMDGMSPPDGHPDIIFSRTGNNFDNRNIYLVNNGDGSFTDRSSLFPARGDIPDEHTEEITVCRMNGNDSPIVFHANGNRHGSLFLQVKNKVVERTVTGPAHGLWLSLSEEYGLDIDDTIDATDVVECVDVDNDNSVDIVFIGNYGSRNYLYVRNKY